MEQLLVAAVPPAVTAGLAALGVWLQGRNRRGRHRREVDEARERITLITAWLAAHQQLATPTEHELARKQALIDLDAAYAIITADTPGFTQDPRMGAPKPWGRSGSERLGDFLSVALLIGTRPTSAPAVVVLVLYYLSLAWLMLWIAAAVLFGLGIAFSTADDWSFVANVAAAVGVTLLALVVGLAPALVLHLVYRLMPQRARLPSESGRG